MTPHQFNYHQEEARLKQERIQAALAEPHDYWLVIDSTGYLVCDFPNEELAERCVANTPERAPRREVVRVREVHAEPALREYWAILDTGNGEIVNTYTSRDAAEVAAPPSHYKVVHLREVGQ
jgi:hypothetical protein